MKKIKDSIMMPPPKSRTKSVMSDASEELRKNLLATDTLTNISDNSAFLDDINKLIKENNEEIFNRRESFSNNYSSNQIFCGPKNSIQHLKQINNIFDNKEAQSNIHSNSEELEPKSSFKFNLTNYIYSGSNENVNNNIVSQKCLEKLKKNLTSNNLSTLDSDNNESKSSTQINSPFKCFQVLPKPSNNQEIKHFVENMLFYMKDKDNCNDVHNSLVFLKIKLQTRYNDYKNKGLRTCYFMDSLIKMQKELISKIYQYCGMNAVFENGNINPLKIYIAKYLFPPKKSRAKSFSDSSSRKSSDKSELSMDEMSNCSNGMLKRKRTSTEELCLSKLEK